MKNYIKSVVTLTLICAVVAVLLSAVNYVTDPIIQAQEESAANDALAVVLPGGEGFEEIDLSAYEMPSSIVSAHKEKNGGYVFKMEVTGYASGMVIMCGVDAEGNVAGTTCLQSSETNGAEKTYGDSLVGKNLDNVGEVDTVAGSTKTTTAYRSAVKDALTARAILGGEKVEIEKTPEELLAMALAEALPASEGKCTPMFVPEKLEGVDNVYAADNGSGYVLLMGEEYVGVGADGKAVGSSANAAAAEAAVSVITASNMTEIDISAYAELPKQVTAVYVTDSGNYVFRLAAEGYNMRDKYAQKKEPIVIMVAVGADRAIIACETVSQNESANIGALCALPEFYTQFNGKTEENYKEIDAIAGATVTTNAYTSAISKVFEAIKIMEGEAQ